MLIVPVVFEQYAGAVSVTIVGNAFTVTDEVAVAVHPFESVPVTV